MSNNSFTAWSMALFIAWILTFPFFGSVTSIILKPTGNTNDILTYTFLGFHALGYLCGAIIEKRLKQWKRLMLLSLLTVLIVNITFWLLPANLWHYGMAILGFASAFYVLGWSRPFSEHNPSERFRITVSIIIKAILISILLILLSYALNYYFLLLLTLSPLAVILIILVTQEPFKKEELIDFKPEKGFSSSSMLILFLIIIMLYLNLGILYGDLPFVFHLSYNYPMVYALYTLIPSLIIYTLIFRYHHKIARHYLLSTGIALSGLAYVSLIYFDDIFLSYILTVTLLQTGFALIHLLIWTLLGDLAHVFGKPVRFFGYNLLASITGIIFGGTFGKYLFIKTGNPKLFISIFALATICMAIMIIPWLKENVEVVIATTLLQKRRHNSRLFTIADEIGLTQREMTVVGKLLEGLENKLIARQLNISETTLKTHLRNIYRKYDVGNKSEFLAKLARKLDHH